ncbi:glycosyltransferase family 1 protein, partial [Enterococcus faecalis]|nr:glycosyltransferase family 1 protein [Enterococcus faecalis]
MKKILFLSPTGTMDNGAEISIFNLMKYLVEQGYEVVNIAPVSGDVEVNDYSRIFESNGIKCFLVSNQRWWWEDAPGMLFGSE